MEVAAGNVPIGQGMHSAMLRLLETAGYSMGRQGTTHRTEEWGSGGRRFKSDRPDQIYQGFPIDGF